MHRKGIYVVDNRNLVTDKVVVCGDCAHYTQNQCHFEPPKVLVFNPHVPGEYAYADTQYPTTGPEAIGCSCHMLFKHLEHLP